ncbi:hypothetical protein BESB_011090 [Besnoitia besnoiti]|uniref:Uncharacterized protein n=1 Tax=Besnoitia besnoiti TaxID=94643 RepID=A0A2A9MQW3_BESBE|nr:hypothetical protein BESB_011090 [Besnoitia besnoiti]PFH38767.1 hypothetical protein BESB_011090 [Besnoitia besnoiti]
MRMTTQLPAAPPASEAAAATHKEASKLRARDRQDLQGEEGREEAEITPDETQTHADEGGGREGVRRAFREEPPGESYGGMTSDEDAEEDCFFGTSFYVLPPSLHASYLCRDLDCMSFARGGRRGEGARRAPPAQKEAATEAPQRPTARVPQKMCSHSSAKAHHKCADALASVDSDIAEAAASVASFAALLQSAPASLGGDSQVRDSYASSSANGVAHSASSVSPAFASPPSPSWAATAPAEASAPFAPRASVSPLVSSSAAAAEEFLSACGRASGCSAFSPSPNSHYLLSDAPLGQLRTREERQRMVAHLLRPSLPSERGRGTRKRYRQPYEKDGLLRVVLNGCIQKRIALVLVQGGAVEGCFVRCIDRRQFARRAALPPSFVRRRLGSGSLDAGSESTYTGDSAEPADGRDSASGRACAARSAESRRDGAQAGRRGTRGLEAASVSRWRRRRAVARIILEDAVLYPRAHPAFAAAARNSAASSESQSRDRGGPSDGEMAFLTRSASPSDGRTTRGGPREQRSFPARGDGAARQAAGFERFVAVCVKPGAIAFMFGTERDSVRGLESRAKKKYVDAVKNKVFDRALRLGRPRW